MWSSYSAAVNVPLPNLREPESITTGPRPRLMERHSLLLGLCLMFAFTWPFYSRLGLFVGYGLAVGAIIATAMSHGPKGVRDLLSRFLIWRVALRWYFLVLFLPALLSISSVALHAMFWRTSLDFDHVEARRIFGEKSSLWPFVIPFFIVDALTNGEELGWRGFVLPGLQKKWNALTSSIVLGLIWGVWHLPRFWHEGNPQGIWAVIAHTIAAAVLCTWISNSTRGSLLLLTLFHAAQNSAYVFLPVNPASAGLNQELIRIAVEIIAAIAVILFTGPRHLSRENPENRSLGSNLSLRR